MSEFKPWDKISRLNRDVIVTEKIDGTNGLVFVSDDFSTVLAGSRTRWVTPAQDNFGFARWVKEHEEELRTGLGPGYHYGEWWGQGIQRRYGQEKKHFSLFNVGRWNADNLPKCCSVVPTLASGPLAESVASALARLRAEGSSAAPGFMDPEGVVIFHSASQHLYKVTLMGDESPKGPQ